MSEGENKLRCNNLACRKLVAQQGKAVVTTCSRESLTTLTTFAIQSHDYPSSNQYFTFLVSHSFSVADG